MMGIRLRVRGPNAGGYDLYLDDQQICAGASAQEAARYIRDAWIYSTPVFPEYLKSTGEVDTVLPPDVRMALQIMGALPWSQARETVVSEGAQERG